MARRLGISEARRLLPELVRTIAREGGQVDITHRGKSQVSILRTADVKRAKGLRPSEDAATRVILNIPSADLVPAIRAIRREHRPHTWWVDDDKPLVVKRPRRRPGK